MTWNWGDLDHFPMRADVWGTAAEWAGAVAGFLAFGIALWIFRHDRRAKRRGQAALVTVSKDNATVIKVNNSSEKPIYNVQAVVGPMSMLTGYITGEFDQMKARSSKGQVVEFPSYEFYVLVHKLLRQRKQRFSQTTPSSEHMSVAPGGFHSVNVPELLEGAADVHVIFRDASGLDWAINARTARVQRAKFTMPKAERFVGRMKARWWIAKNAIKYFWRNYCDHPKGKPDLKP